MSIDCGASLSRPLKLAASADVAQSEGNSFINAGWMPLRVKLLQPWSRVTGFRPKEGGSSPAAYTGSSDGEPTYKDPGHYPAWPRGAEKRVFYPVSGASGGGSSAPGFCPSP